MNIVVVESPAKAKTINKYLGKDYQVFASFGHVRDLPAKDGSVKPDDDFAMSYETDPDSKKHLSAIASALKNADRLYLATDPDREGEAISWHVLEALKESKALKKTHDVKRIVFHEITKKAILEAVAHPRDIDMNLVNAQQARRALDYLVGFTLSPVLWRKLPGSRSAGRVQSVALRLICERDEEIERFISQEYWDIKAVLGSAAGQTLNAKLVEYQGKKLEKFSITHEKQAKDVAHDVQSKHFTVSRLEPKQVRRHPAPPFTTSTLQQEAARKCGFSAKKTMQLAQKLYEGVSLGGETVGLITYMRTDGVTVSAEAINAARDLIGNAYGREYVPGSPRMYKTKAKNAQEAHEAIRPTDVTRTPQHVASHLDRDMLRLYELIWKRLVASQMESAILDQLIVDMQSSDRNAVLRTSGSVIRFDGFLKLYQEGRDDDDDEDNENARLPALKEGEPLDLREVRPEQHFTEPPPRYSEASLVKKLEELGIGRPSTYAAIISVLQDRSYVRLDKKRFIAETLGRVVNAFLVSFFERYVQYGFTADLETQLDDVSAGERDWKEVLREFWKAFFNRIEESKKLSIPEVLDALDQLLEPFLFGLSKEGENKRTCPSCQKGTLGLKLGKYGPYIACSAYPDCNYKRQIATGGEAGEQGADGAEAEGPKILGNDPATGETISLRKGPYGHYVQLGEGAKPKRASLLKGMSAGELTLEQALALLSLPREVGTHPESGKPITANNGKFGPYLLHDGKFTSIPAGEDVLTIGINRAVDILSNPPRKGGAGGGNTQSIKPLRVVGEHPEGGEIALYAGRYGPYVKYGKINASLPRNSEPEQLTLEEAIDLITARGNSTGGKKAPAKKAPKAAAAKKTTAKPKAEAKTTKTVKAKKNAGKAG